MKQPDYLAAEALEENLKLCTPYDQDLTAWTIEKTAAAFGMTYAEICRNLLAVRHEREQQQKRAQALDNAITAALMLCIFAAPAILHYLTKV